jgi:dTDP-glucose 4,6-dehydratase
MKVLLTGASGFVGKNVLKHLVAKTDWEFLCPVTYRHNGRGPLVPTEYHGGVSLAEFHDRVKVRYHDLRGQLDVGHFDVILNLASQSHVDRSIADPLRTVENNVSSMLQLLEHARRHRPEMFIQFSTDEVFGQAPWGEYAPSNPYAASKAAQEMCAMAWRRTYDIPLVITNANNLIGPGQHEEKFVPKIAKLIRDEQTVEIHAVQGEPGRRHYTPVKNAAEFLRVLIANAARLKWTAGGMKPARLPVGGSTELDNLEMAHLVAETLGKDLRYILVDAYGIRPGYDRLYSTSDCHPLMDGVPMTAGQTIRECLKEALCPA